MPKSWYIDPRLDPRAQQVLWQEKQGLALVAEQIQDVPSSELEEALTEEDHPLFLRLQKAVQAAVGANEFFAGQIVVFATEDELARRGVL